MRLTRKSVVLPLVAVALAAAAYAELVLDVRTPRSTLVEVHLIQAVMNWNSQSLDKAMKAKYGPNSETNIEWGPPRLVITVDGKVVHKAPLSEMFEGVRASFEIGASGQQMGEMASTFPIWFAVPSPPDHSSAMVRRRYFVDSNLSEKHLENHGTRTPVPVRILGPAAVTATVCSKCAASEPSEVEIDHSSSWR